MKIQKCRLMNMYGSLDVPVRNARKIKGQYSIDVCRALNFTFSGYPTISQYN
jgi:hypothetical protein